MQQLDELIVGQEVVGEGTILGAPFLGCRFGFLRVPSMAPNLNSLLHPRSHINTYDLRA
jgi:hypothetical protein